MARRKKTKAKPEPEYWEVHHEVKLEGIGKLSDRSQFSVRAGVIGRQPGRYVFRRMVFNLSTGESWVDARRPDGHRCSVRPESIKTVHRINKPIPTHVKGVTL
jgi:hypothetical protein